MKAVAHVLEKSRSLLEALFLDALPGHRVPSLQFITAPTDKRAVLKECCLSNVAVMNEARFCLALSPQAKYSQFAETATTGHELAAGIDCSGHDRALVTTEHLLAFSRRRVPHSSIEVPAAGDKVPPVRRKGHTCGFGLLPFHDVLYVSRRSLPN